MYSIPALIVGILGIVAIGQMIITGRATPSRLGFNRQNDPLIYWSALIAGAAIVLVLFYIAFLDELRGI
jgi:hypothetical protein